MSDETTPTWGYSKRDARIFDLKEGESLPKGYHAHPAMVPGSDAEAQYRADAEREGASVPWDKAPQPATDSKSEES